MSANGLRLAASLAARWLAGAAIVVTILPFGARVWWGFDLFTHFRLQYVAGLALLTAALGLLGHRGWAAVTAAAALVCGWPLLPYLGTRAASEQAADLSLISVNVSFRNDGSAPALLAAVAAADPDFVLVIELTDRWLEGLAPLETRYPYSVTETRAGPFGIGLFSKTPVPDARIVELGATPAVDARVDLGARGAIRLIGVHLRPPTSADWAAERDQQLELLARRARENRMALAVCGDFNISPYSPHFRDLLAEAGLRDSRSGLEFTWPSYNPLLGIPLDHCLVSASVDVVEHRKLGAFGSDHYPLLVSLAVTQP